MDTQIPSFSIVVPCYNSSRSLVELVNRVVQVFSNTTFTYEIILINDGSSDNTWQVIEDLGQRYAQVVGIDLTRNFGQQSAVLCGFQFAHYQYIVTIDDDLQHKPEDILALYKQLSDNELDLVIASFASKQHTFIRRLGTRLVQYLSNHIVGTPTGFKFSSFRIMKKYVAKNALQFKVANPVVGFLILKTTNKIANYEVEHDARKHGKSNYSIWDLINYCLTMLLDYSTIPLKIVGYMGVVIAVFSFTASVFYLIKWWLGLITVSGFMTFVLLILFFFGLLFISIGVIGAYFIRILQNSSIHPLYLVRTEINLSSQEIPDKVKV